jgi:hypothetical protein
MPVATASVRLDPVRLDPHKVRRLRILSINEAGIEKDRGERIYRGRIRRLAAAEGMHGGKKGNLRGN